MGAALMEAFAPMIMALLVIALIFAPAALASRYNRNPLGWFLLGIISTPILALVILLFIGKVDMTTGGVTS
jgi:hypothetical protein